LDTVEITATVKSVDYQNRIVTLYGPAGTIRPITVNPTVPGLDTVKPGDRVVMLVTEALAIDVQTP
jgi:hypothetical protein